MAPAPNRPNLTDPAVLDALAHPVRLDVLGYLMSAGPATASQCARAVGDTPSNCSYHLRVLASHGLVEPDGGGDGRTRPWRATLTGFTSDIEDDPNAPGDQDARDREASRAGLDAMEAASLQLDNHLARDYLRTHDTLPEAWRDSGHHASFGLLVTPTELAGVVAEIDAVLRPFLAATRVDAPADAGHVHVSTLAVPRAWSGATAAATKRGES